MTFFLFLEINNYSWFHRKKSYWKPGYLIPIEIFKQELILADKNPRIGYIFSKWSV